MTKTTYLAAVLAVAAGGTTTPALAQEAAETVVAADAATVTYVFNTLLFLIGGFLVMWMAAGFAMLEAGLVRSKNVAMQCTKNIALYSIAGLMYFIVGYNLMYDGVDGGFMGSFTPKIIPDPSDDAGDYSAASDWFFQMVFCATTASIVSGTLAERIKLNAFLIFTVVLTGIIYPLAGSWKWGGGWLGTDAADAWIMTTFGQPFQDFAGSTLVHSVGGWAALAGALILGPRLGKYGKDGRVYPILGSSLPLATLGTFILWLGWFGFNGASQLAIGTIEDASAVSRIFANTNTAAAAGAVAAMLLTMVRFGKIDLTMVLNGALAGLVSITAEPLTPSLFSAALIGAVGGVLVVITVPLLDKMRIDDVVGAIPVHLVCGIWGTLAVPLTNGDSTFGGQIVGIAAYGAFTFGVSLVLWLVVKATMGIRVTEEQEMAGLDASELGMEAYPEFGKGSQSLA